MVDSCKIPFFINYNGLFFCKRASTTEEIGASTSEELKVKVKVYGPIEINRHLSNFVLIPNTVVKNAQM